MKWPKDDGLLPAGDPHRVEVLPAAPSVARLYPLPVMASLQVAELEAVPLLVPAVALPVTELVQSVA